MKDFEAIDWKQYNKPPFYQQWLCEGDPHKLATFGDQNLTDIVLQVLKLKDQWNLDSVKGALLDRIGKLLQEARNGNDDELYRQFLRLRTMLNTANGSLNNIIQIMKFIYAAEVIHIAPDYPAGLVIEHQGELTPGLDFNAIIKQVIPAGVAYSTKEILDFIEELIATDTQRIQVHHDPEEAFESRVYHNRRILHDGKTILPNQLKVSCHNGLHFHNGYLHHNGHYEGDATNYLKPPFTRRSGYLEKIDFGFALNMKDYQFSRLFHNGSITRRPRAQHNGVFLHNGAINYMPSARHNGWSPYSMGDAMSALKLNQTESDNFPSSENSLVNVSIYDTDHFRKPYNHDGTYQHNSSIFHSGWALDFLALLQRLFLQDTAAGPTYHNGILRHNGTENHSGLGGAFAYENQLFNIGVPVEEEMPATETQLLSFENDTSEMVSRYFHDRKYKHNSAIPHDGPCYDKMKMQIELSPDEDKAAGILRHNNSIAHNRAENHSFTGTQPLYETLAVNMENNVSENVAASESHSPLVVDHEQTDEFIHDYTHDRKITHNGTAYHYSFINDKNVMDFALVPMEDTHLGQLLHNGSIKRDGTEKHRSQRIAYDAFTVGIRYHHYHNGVYFRNSGIKHNAGVLIPLDIA